MSVIGTIASGAAKLGKEAVKGIFPGLFGGDKKRTINKIELKEVKPEDGEFGVFGAGITQNNELLSQSISIQKDQNVILDQILKTLADIKKNKKGGGNSEETSGLLSILADIADLIPDSVLKKGGQLAAQGVKQAGGLMARALPYAAGAAPFAAAGFAGAGVVGSAYLIKKSVGEYADIPNRSDKGMLNASSTKADGTEMSEAEMREQAFKQRGSRLGGRGTVTPTPLAITPQETLPVGATSNKPADAEKISNSTTAQIIGFTTREILFSAKEMFIKTDEIKINGAPTSGGAQVLGSTPSVPGGGGTPQIPSAPGTTPQAPGGGATPGGFGPAEKTGENGKLPDSMLASVGIGNHKAQPAAAEAFKAMREAAKKEKVDLGITDSYRTYAAQVDVKRRKPNLAATPGKSNHGWGLAFDMSFGSNMNSPGFKWMQQHAPEFGFKGPLQKPFEPWHWEYKGGGGGAATAEKTGPTGTEPSTAQAAPTATAAAINAVKPAGGGLPQMTGGGLPQMTGGSGVSGASLSAPTYRQQAGLAPAPTSAGGPSEGGGSGGPTGAGGPSEGGEPSAAAIAGKSGSTLPSVPPIEGETQQELANRIKSVSPGLKNQQCVTLAKAAVGSSDSVTTWRKGANATSNELPVGTPVATFMDRKGGASERYDAGGTGSPGTGTTHAATVAGYIKDKDGKITGMQVWEQYTGSGGPRLKTYPAGQGFGEKNASNYHAIEQEGKDGQRTALGGKNNKYQAYLEKQQAAAAEKANPQVAKVEPPPEPIKPQAVAEAGPKAEPPSPAPDAVAETGTSNQPPGEATAPVDTGQPVQQASLQPEEQPPAAPATDLAPVEPAAAPAAAAPPASSGGGGGPKPQGGSSKPTKPGSMGAPSNQLIGAYLTVAA